MTKFCARCGQPMEDSAKFCPNCGAPSASAGDRPAAGGQAPYGQGAAPQQPYSQQPYQTPYQPQGQQQSYQQLPYQQPWYQPYPQGYAAPPPKAKNKTGLIAGIVAAAAVILVFLLTAFLWPGFLRADAGKPSGESPAVSRATAAPKATDKSGAKGEAKTTAEPANDDAPKAVTDPALTGTWGYHMKDASSGLEVDVVFTFNSDGTGSYTSNGYTMPIVSYVATKEPYTQYEEDGYLLTVYWGVMRETIGDTTHEIRLDPIEYGYRIDGDTLRITFTRDIDNSYTDFTRE